MCAGYSCKRGFNIFFMTDISTDASHYCLLNIKKYDDKRKDTKQIIFVDPGVMELKKMDEYKYVEKLHWLANNNLKSNEYISIDYPCDMVDIILSVDNTKWTQGCNDKLRAKYIRNPKQTQLTPTKHKQSGISCSKDTRNEFFLEYMNDLKYANIKLKN
jgi:hypothetical protein